MDLSDPVRWVRKALQYTACKWKLQMHLYPITLSDNYKLHYEVNSTNNKAVTDRRLCPKCCHLGSYLWPTRTWLQEVVLSLHCLQRVFLCAKPKAACEPHCLSLAMSSSSLSLCANTMSSLKQEVRNVSPCHQRRNEPWPQITHTKNLVQIGRLVPKIWSQTDKHTDT